MNTLNGYDFEDLEPGMHASFAKIITEADNRAGVPQRLRRVVQPVTRPSACATRIAAQASLAA